MKLLNRFFRLMRINYILMRYNIDEVILGTHRFFLLRCVIYLNPFYWTATRKLPRGERVRLAIEALGPIFVKAGQILSTRRDILPDDIANSLAQLQDRVTPFSGKKAKRMIKTALGLPLRDVFSYFDKNALASASIAQVHAATLITGESVVVKVLRPNIHQTIASDLDLLRLLAKLANRTLSGAMHFKPKALVDEIAETLTNELDLLREGANASQLKRNFANDASLTVPNIHWEFSRLNVLTMERMHGIPIHHVSALKAAGFDLKKIAESLINVFFTQVFRDNFFHADLHPGNLFVNEKQAHQPALIAVDFGIVGSLSQRDQRYIAENMMAFFKRDYQRVAELHIASGWLPPDTRVDQFEGAIRAVSEPIFAQPFADISFGHLLMRLFQVAQRYQINIQPQLILLQKTLLGMEGLCRELAPHLNLWEAATPQIEKWLKQQVGVKAFIQRVRANLPRWSEQLPELPSLVYDVLMQNKEAELSKRYAPAPTPRSKLTPWLAFGSGVVMASVIFILFNVLGVV
jgi:ubiquinone biosynthesis protein